MSITDWDTYPDEQRFIGGVFDAMFQKKNLELTARLLTGIDENWFQDEHHKHLFQAVFQHATLAYDPDVRITVGGVLDAAEEASQETGWAREVFRGCSERAGIFEPERFLDDEAPLWWEKQKRKKIQQRLAMADQLLTVPPSRSTMQSLRDYLASAMNAIEEEPTCNMPEVNPMMETYEKFKNPLPGDSVISTGMRLMDTILGGGLSGPGAPSPGKLIIITARPGVGKTQVALNLGMRVAMRGWKVAMWSMEMQPEQIFARMFCALDHDNCRREGRTIGGKMTFGMVAGGLLEKHPQVLERYVAMEPQTRVLADNFRVVPGELHTAAAICSTMKLFARTNPDVRLFIIDHLGLLDFGGGGANRATAVGDATRMIKTTANDLGIDVILLCQVNRGLEQRQDKMPELSDLRDSGRIEEDADVVVGLMRPWMYDPTHDEHDLQISILKNRQGSSGQFGVNIDNDCCAVYESINTPF